MDRQAFTHRPSVHERPEQAGEVVDGQHRAGVADGGVDLGPIADDPRIGQQSFAIRIGVRGDAFGIEAVERVAVALSLAEDGDPGQPCLGALEAQQLEQVPIVPDRHAPLRVVVGDVERIAPGPLAPDDPIGIGSAHPPSPSTTDANRK